MGYIFTTKNDQNSRLLSPTLFGYGKYRVWLRAVTHKMLCWNSQEHLLLDDRFFIIFMIEALLLRLER